MGQDMNLFEDALACDDEARAVFSWLPAAHRAEFVGWIRSATTETAQRRRIGAAVDILAGRDILRMQ
jgi:Bacteriocin-protection, YdeI or OmpD-Associated